VPSGCARVGIASLRILAATSYRPLVQKLWCQIYSKLLAQYGSFPGPHSKTWLLRNSKLDKGNCLKSKEKLATSYCRHIPLRDKALVFVLSVSLSIWKVEFYRPRFKPYGPRIVPWFATENRAYVLMNQW
jgi:hypothetical protein